MRRAMRLQLGIVMIACLFVGLSLSTAWCDAREDAALFELAGPDTEYKKVLADANSKYLKAVEDQIKATKPSKKLSGEMALKRVKRLEEAKRKFEEDHSLVWVSTLQKAAAEYEAAVRGAKEKLDAAYQKIIGKLIREKEDELAEKFDARKDEFIEHHDATHPPRVVAIWNFGLAGAAPGQIQLLSNGRVNSQTSKHKWKTEGNQLIFYWQDERAPGGVWIDTCTLSADRKSIKGRNQLGASVVGTLVTEDL
jgi:hypothetical protein